MTNDLRRALPGFLLLLLISYPSGATATEPPATTDRGTPDTAAELERLEAELERLRRQIGELGARLGAGGAPAEGEREEIFAARLAALEEAVRQLAGRLAELEEAARAGADAADALARSEQRRVQLSVYGTLNLADYRDEDSRFDAEAFELVLSGRPHPRLGFFAEIEFERAAAVGDGDRGGEILMEQAYATYRLGDGLNLRAGVLLVPFGNFNVDHYAPTRDVISKPLVSTVVAPSDWTDNGLGIEGSRLVGARSVLSYELYAIAGLDADITARGTRAARQGFGEDNNNDKALAGRFAWSWDGRLELGLSGYTGKYDDASTLRLNGWALDWLLTAGPVKLTGEYNALRAERPAGPDADLSGYYGRVVYDFGHRLLARGWHGRDFPDARLSLVAQYGAVDLSGPEAGSFVTHRERRFTLGLNYRPTHQWVLKLNHERGEASDRPLLRGDSRGWLASIGFTF